jgi:trypsin
MRRSLLSLLLLAAALPAPAQAIVGGSDVPAGEYRFVANISIGGALGCTGTLIAPSWVMTAGHCSSLTGAAAPSPIPMLGDLYAITLGTVQADGTGGEERFVKTNGVHVPGSYSAQNGNGSDVGLLELTEPVTDIAPMKLAAVDERSIWEPGVTVTAAGFGVTEADGDAPDVMQRVDLPIVTDSACGLAYSDPTPILGDAFDPATEVCAGFKEGGKDSCQGDSGGPLLGHTGSELRLVGATSRGQGCAEPGFPGVYARVAGGSMRAFVKGLVPDAFAPEGVSETPASAPSPSAPGQSPPVDPGASGFPEPTATTQPGNPAKPAVCGRRSVALRSRDGGRLRTVRIRIGGRTVLKRHGTIAPFRFEFGTSLHPAGKTRVRIFTRTSKGVRRINVRTYDGCRRTSSRTRSKR